MSSWTISFRAAVALAALMLCAGLSGCKTPLERAWGHSQHRTWPSRSRIPTRACTTWRRAAPTEPARTPRWASTAEKAKPRRPPPPPVINIDNDGASEERRGAEMEDSKTNDRRGERGSVMVIAALAMTALLLFAALAIDVGVVWSSRTQGQSVATPRRSPRPGDDPAGRHESSDGVSPAREKRRESASPENSTVANPTVTLQRRRAMPSSSASGISTPGPSTIGGPDRSGSGHRRARDHADGRRDNQKSPTSSPGCSDAMASKSRTSRRRTSASRGISGRASSTCRSRSTAAISRRAAAAATSARRAERQLVHAEVGAGRQSRLVPRVQSHARAERLLDRLRREQPVGQQSGSAGHHRQRQRGRHPRRATRPTSTTAPRTPTLKYLRDKFYGCKTARTVATAPARGGPVRADPPARPGAPPRSTPGW